MHHTYRHCTVPRYIWPSKPIHTYGKKSITLQNQTRSTELPKKRHLYMPQYSLKVLFINAWTVGRFWLYKGNCFSRTKCYFPQANTKLKSLGDSRRVPSHWKQLSDATVWLSPWRQPVTATGFRAQTPEHKHFDWLQKATVCKRHTQDPNNSAWSNPKHVYSSLV